MSFRIQFQEVPHSDAIKSECEDLAGTLEAEFPEARKFEVTISQNRRDEYKTHLHVVGKDVSVNSTAESRELRETLTEAFDKAHRQLRKHHDKVIFGRRREGQKGSGH